ncbi:MAG TPA: hypothetical protein VFJ85_02840 [Acidimicrobiales bacterium]|nr:hypothetical protein [Acidimicrobiales bacterium]
MTETVAVEGLEAFQRDLAAAVRDLPGESRRAAVKAAQLVAAATREALGSLGGSAPKVADTVAVLTQQAGAAVTIGGGSSVGGLVALGNEFGARRFRQFPPWAGSGDGSGYALGRSARSKEAQVVDAFGEMVDRLLQRAFPS